jgi:hypothetical protein
MSSTINQYLILNKKSYFQIADEFVKLTQLFKNETTLEKLNFWVDMVIYPILTIVSIIFFNQKMGVFTIISIHKTVTKWQQYLRFLELKHETDEWKTLVKSVGGPFISTNDDMYHMYVYADGMQRLHDDLFRSPFLLSKKGTKCL